MSKILPRLLIISAYHAQSHDYWAQQLIQQLDEYDCTLIALPARYYAWRMGGNALSLMAEFSQELAQHYDVVIATSMVDLATLKGLCPHLQSSQLILYCHENQFEYPQHAALSNAAKQQQNSNRVSAQMRSIYSAMAADKVIFNSHFNRNTFLEGCESLLKKMPDFTCPIAPLIKAKSYVAGIPLAQDVAEKALKVNEKAITLQADTPLRIVWAARWEFDKGMDALLCIADQLEQKKIPVEWLVLGQQFRKMPEAAQQFLARHSHSIVQSGFIESREEYLRCLDSADIVLSTSLHEFYGIAVLEAVACGCWPLLPKQQVYPEMYGEAHLYQCAESAVEQIKAIYIDGLNAKLCLLNDPVDNARTIEQYRAIIAA